MRHPAVVVADQHAVGVRRGASRGEYRSSPPQPLGLAAPVHVEVGFPRCLATAGEAEGLEAHGLQRDIAGQDHQVGPEIFCPYFCLIGHSRRGPLSRLTLSGQLLSRAKRCPRDRRRHDHRRRGRCRRCARPCGRTGRRSGRSRPATSPANRSSTPRGRASTPGNPVLERFRRVVEAGPERFDRSECWLSRSNRNCWGHQSLLLVPAAGGAMEWAFPSVDIAGPRALGSRDSGSDDRK